MTDELTPEERKALDSLPRERMPIGLEGRVVDAMRDHGFLAKRRRMIVLTNSRVAGVLAASIAVIVGAYSIGLHRGGEQVIPLQSSHRELGIPEAPREEDEQGRVQAPPLDKIQPESKLLESQHASERDALQKDQPRANEPTPTDVTAPSRLPSSQALRSDESKKDLDWQLKSKEEGRSQAQGSVASPLAEPAPASNRQRPPQPSVAFDAAKRPTTFMLNGKAVTVEAPDSVRIVEDEQGRVLLIYTSDGIIRIRLAD
jgi:hypothetical protein